jgi:hypothetical protein
MNLFLAGEGKHDLGGLADLKPYRTSEFKVNFGASGLGRPRF